MASPESKLQMRVTTGSGGEAERRSRGKLASTLPGSRRAGISYELSGTYYRRDASPRRRDRRGMHVTRRPKKLEPD
jgi:hypothetical protein